ncbi:MAG: YbaB/EbfC family nucleoid-associated protein [Rhodanobacteraceae bacterium]|jgi:DNA-binding YbaB/EbfC family protein|nr:YbaB/EbfC family nucleoid-associated protein [Rhodanobacteraceae bacterium]MBL8245040.1 YbaB/EbfC family nucleoid-associated protein [Rhodanobacteraceae bacterium]
MRGGLGNILQQAQKMQEELQKQMAQAQKELESAEVLGSAGGNMVVVTMSGRHEVRRVRIDPQLLKDDPEMLEDLVAAAVNDAVNKVGEMSSSRMAKVTGGMNLPPGFKLPF